MNLVNLTPHDIVIQLMKDPGKVVIPASGTVARVDTTERYVGTVNGIPVVTQVFGDIVGLPDPAPNTKYIVSQIVLAAAKAAGRTDCLAPNTARAIRDDQGHIIAVLGFVS